MLTSGTLKEGGVDEGQRNAVRRVAVTVELTFSAQTCVFLIGKAKFAAL